MTDFFKDSVGGNNGNDGKDAFGFALTAATFTTSTKNLSETNAFTGYTFVAGDQIAITGGTGVTPDLYDIASKTDDSNIVLVADIGGTDPTDVTSSDGPWATLQFAADTVTAGDHVFCMNTADESTATQIDFDGTTGTRTSRIRFFGANDRGQRLLTGHFVIKASSSIANLIAPTSVPKHYTFEGIDFFGNALVTSDLIDGDLSGEGDFWTFTRCKIHDGGDAGINFRGNAGAIINCEIYDNTGNGLESTNGSATRWANWIVAGCNIHDNGAAGIGNFASQDICFANNQIHNNAGGGIIENGATSIDNANFVLANNSIFKNTGAGINITNISTKIVIYNNIIRSNTGDGLVIGDTTAAFAGFIDFNCYSNNSSPSDATVTPGDNNVFTDPLFVNETAGSEDFRLDPGSPCHLTGLGGDSMGQGPLNDQADGGGGGGDFDLTYLEDSSVSGTSKGTVITASSTINTKGSYTTLIASTSGASVVLRLTLNPDTTNVTECLIDIATGAAASEVNIMENIKYYADTGANQDVPSNIYITVDIPSGTRISARMQAAVSSDTFEIIATTYSGSFTVNDFSATTWGANTANSRGSLVPDPGGSTNTLGAYTEIVASTADDITELMLSFGPNGNTAMASAHWIYQIATGAASSEVTIHEGIAIGTTSTELVWPVVIVVPVVAPAGTRLAIRCQCTIATADDRLLDVVAIGLNSTVTAAEGAGGDLIIPKKQLFR